MKRISVFILLILTVFTLFGCKKNLEILGENEVEIGCSIALSHNYNGKNKVAWKSENEAIATVLDGMVIGIGEGKVVISAEVDGMKATKEITVLNSKIVITIEGETVIAKGEKVQFFATTSKEIEEKIAWKSSDESILIVDENGFVTGIEAGNATISASVFGNVSTFDVKVVLNEPSIIIEGTNIVNVGGSVDLKVTVISLIQGTLKFTSSDESIATVDENGVIRAIGVGKAIISVNYLEKTETFEIEVVDDVNKIRITGSNIVRLDQTIYLKCNYDCYWSSSDTDIVDIFEDGEVFAGQIGTVTITATDKNDPNNKATFELTVIGETPRSISINGKNVVGVGNEIVLSISTKPNDASSRVYYTSSDENVATVTNDGKVVGKKIGKVVIKAVSMEDSEVFSEIEIEVMLPAPTEILVSGKDEMAQGSHNNLSVSVLGENVTKEVVWKSSDPKIAIVYQGIVLGVNKGTVTISAESILDSSIYGSMEITVKGYVSEEESKEDLDRVEKILSGMTLEEKVGQMFVVGFNTTTLNDSLSKAIENYHFGNVIYMGYNVSDPTILAELSNAVQEKMIKENKVPAFISTDQEGGRVARLTNGGTHFISNMAMGATGDYQNTYLEGLAMGKELRNYGINLNFAPVLDVNNNPENPIIGIRSYSDNPLLVSLYGKNMFLGLQESNVMGCSKHFPGHGNTSVDSHYGLPTITTSMDELYQTELAPFVSAVANGIDSIMTTHIIFTAIDKDYPATLSKKVLTDLLREELGFTGLIITDGMEMDAVSKNFGSYEKTAVMAIKAGVDILTYTTTANPAKAHTGIINAIKNGELTEERINESVRRILLKKLKYDILDNYQAQDKDISEMLKENEELNLKFAMESLTLAKGEFNGLDKNKKTLIISPTTSYSLGNGLESNSMANYTANYLKENGFKNCDYKVVSANVSQTDLQNILSSSSEYEQIVVALSNVKTNKYNNSATLVKELAKKDLDLVVIALDTPYDLMAYSSNVKNYICVYGYQKATVIAISKYLNGEFEANGILAVSGENFK